MPVPRNVNLDGIYTECFQAGESVEPQAWMDTEVVNGARYDLEWGTVKHKTIVFKVETRR